MTYFTGIIVYILIWWTVIFMVLPWGLERDENGVPHHPRLKHKAIMTTLISILIWLILYGVIESDLISFREMAVAMSHSGLN